MGLLPGVAIIGPSRGGKDTAANMLSQYTGLKFLGSTSWWMKGRVAQALGVDDMTAWDTRHENKQFWKKVIDEYRADDPAKVVREMRVAGARIVTGLRPLPELDCAIEEGLISHTIWISRGTWKDPLLGITMKDADTKIFNDGTKEDLRTKVMLVAATLFDHGF